MVSLRGPEQTYIDIFCVRMKHIVSGKLVMTVIPHHLIQYFPQLTCSSSYEYFETHGTSVLNTTLNLFVCLDASADSSVILYPANKTTERSQWRRFVIFINFEHISNFF